MALTPEAVSVWGKDVRVWSLKEEPPNPFGE
jgi:hypothetical protein